MSEKLTGDFRKFMDKSFLGSWDVPDGGDLILTIDHVARDDVQNEKGREKKMTLHFNFYSRASCEARPQHYVIILQSQPISCTRRTFLSFFLHHFDEYTEDKLLFKANLPAFFESFHLRLTMFSQYYDSFRIISFFCSNVFYSSLPVIP